MDTYKVEPNEPKTSTNSKTERINRLAIAAKAGDPRAFEDLYNSLWASALRIVTKQLQDAGNSTADADDILAEKLAELEHILDLWVPEHSFFTYLTRALKNAAIDYMRSPRNHGASRKSDEPEESLSESKRRPQGYRFQQKREIDLDNVPAPDELLPDRSTVGLHPMAKNLAALLEAGFSIEEIRGITGLTAVNIRQITHRNKKRTASLVLN